jgi:hypothetical protein
LTYTIPYDNFFKNKRSGFKIPDQVQGQGAGRSGKRSPAAGGMSHKRGLQRSHWTSDGVLRPLLVYWQPEKDPKLNFSVVNDMNDSEIGPEEEKKPLIPEKKLQLDLSEAMTTSVDDDDDIIELKDEVTLPPKENEPEIDQNNLPPEFLMEKPAEETLADLDAMRIDLAEHEDQSHGVDDLLFEEEDQEEVAVPPFAAEQSLEADDANEVMEITEFDDILSEDDDEMITLVEGPAESESEEEFLELIEVEEDSLPEAGDEKIEEEIIQFDDPEADAEDVELENFINDSLSDEIQIGDELEDDLVSSLRIEAEPEMNLTDQKPATEEFNFNIDTSEISEKIDQLDSIFFDDTHSETENDDEIVANHEDSDAEAEKEDIESADVDSLKQLTSDAALPGLNVNPTHIEQSIERFIEQNYSEKIESMISAIIEKAVAKEINRLKNVLLEDDNPEDF